MSGSSIPPRSILFFWRHATLIHCSRAFLLAIALGAGSQCTPASAASAACAECHQKIYATYRLTPMAASSGPTGAPSRERFDHASFTDRQGFTYRVYQNRGAYFLDFKNAAGSLHGARALPYFVGSGATARSYLLAGDGYLFEAPVAYYTASGKWALAPNYDSYAYPYLTRPA